LSSLSSKNEQKQTDDTHDQQSESYWFPSDLSFSSLFPFQRYSLRDRGPSTDARYPWSSNHFSQGDYYSTSSAGTKSLLSLDLGHPAARGCKSCWEFNHECSLLDKPLVYPCQICSEDRADCELIIPPKRKRGCDNCKRKKKVVFSYLKDARDHHLSCKQFQEMGIQCFSGPAKHQDIQDSQESESLNNSLEEEKSRDALPSVSSHLHSSPPPRPLNLTEEIQPLSVAADVNFLEDPSPHSSFSKSSTDSHIAEARALLEDLLSKPWKPRNSSAPEPQQPSSHEPSTASTETNSLTHQQQEKLEKSRSGIVRIITTSFAHPINFTYEQPPDDNGKPCHFCNDFTYGMLGLGEVKVEVIDYRDGSGYVKIEGGHVGTGHEPTRMCVTCALERVHIVQCCGHTVAGLDGYDPSTFDYDAAFASLEPPALGRRPSWSIRGACCVRTRHFTAESRSRRSISSRSRLVRRPLTPWDARCCCARTAQG